MAENTRKTAEEIMAANKLGTAAENVENISRSGSIGSISTAIGDSFYGINHQQTPNAIQINKDFYGLTFFTRPAMNLTASNIQQARILAPLLTKNEASIPRIIRCLLDSKLFKADPKVSCPLVDNLQAFIPILTNNLISMSGWQDVVAPYMSSHEGVYKEVYGFVDGVTNDYTTYSITANFRNMPGDPITLLFFIWCHYASLVYQGILVPYPEFIIQNEIDYNTRIYRLILDSTKTRVTKIAACGAAFPTSSPMGASFNFESDRPINSSNDQVSISFQAFGSMYQDDILIDEFNRTGELFNPGLADGVREKEFIKIPINALGIFNNRGYPRINMSTYELEWWINADEYNYRMPMIQMQGWKDDSGTLYTTRSAIPK